MVETLYIPSLTVGSTPKILWELIDGLMTDSVNKNLKVEYLVAENRGSSHTTSLSVFDETIIFVLVDIEKQISFRQKLEALLQGENALFSVPFCTPDTCAKSSSLSEKFSHNVKSRSCQHFFHNYWPCSNLVVKQSGYSSCLILLFNAYRMIQRQCIFIFLFMICQ